MEQRQQAMLQLHLSDKKFDGHIGASYNKGFVVNMWAKGEGPVHFGVPANQYVWQTV